MKGKRNEEQDREESKRLCVCGRRDEGRRGGKEKKREE